MSVNRCLWMGPAVAACVSWLGGCDNSVKVSERDLVQVTAQEVQTLLEKDRERTALVDPRNLERYEAAHLPGALHLWVADFDVNDPRLKEARTIVVYGTDWSDVLPVTMSKRLLANKYKDVRTMRGGVAEWIEAGGEVESADDGAQ